MAKLTNKLRDALPKKDFAGPGRSYPVNNRAHAANAKARATQMVEAGKLSPASKAKIDAKANKKLPERGERTKKNVDGKKLGARLMGAK